MRVMTKIRAIGVILSASGLVGCLPADNRPEPGRVVVTATASDAVRSGLVTEDGWTVRFDRFLLALGDISLANGSAERCTSSPYAGFGYLRVIDLARPGVQEVGEAYALGECSVECRTGTGLTSDSARGAGVSQADLDRMVNQVVTASWPPVCGTIPDAVGTSISATAYVVGSATNGDVTKRFAWLLGGYGNLMVLCVGSDLQGSPSPTQNVLTLGAGGTVEFPLVVQGDLLLNASPSAALPTFLFAPFAAADRDGDGTITMDELSVAPAGLGSSYVNMCVTPGGLSPELTGPSLSYYVNSAVAYIVRTAPSAPCSY